MASRSAAAAPTVPVTLPNGRPSPTSLAGIKFLDEAVHKLERIHMIGGVSRRPAANEGVVEKKRRESRNRMVAEFCAMYSYSPQETDALVSKFAAGARMGVREDVERHLKTLA